MNIGGSHERAASLAPGIVYQPCAVCGNHASYPLPSPSRTFGHTGGRHPHTISRLPDTTHHGVPVPVKVGRTLASSSSTSLLPEVPTGTTRAPTHYVVGCMSRVLVPCSFQTPCRLAPQLGTEAHQCNADGPGVARQTIHSPRERPRTLALVSQYRIPSLRNPRVYPAPHHK